MSQSFNMKMCFLHLQGFCVPVSVYRTRKVTGDEASVLEGEERLLLFSLLLSSPLFPHLLYMYTSPLFRIRRDQITVQESPESFAIEVIPQETLPLHLSSREMKIFDRK